MCKYGVIEPVTRMCYYVRWDVHNWTDDEAACAGDGHIGSHLASIESADKQQFFVRYIMERFEIDCVYVGATNRPLYWQWKICK